MWLYECKELNHWTLSRFERNYCTLFWEIWQKHCTLFWKIWHKHCTLFWKIWHTHSVIWTMISENQSHLPKPEWKGDSQRRWMYCNDLQRGFNRVRRGFTEQILAKIMDVEPVARFLSPARAPRGLHRALFMNSVSHGKIWTDNAASL